MAATRDDIWGWLLEGQRQGATHVVVVCDTFEWSDYPVFVLPGYDAAEVIEQRKQQYPSEKVMEVYNLSLDIASQLREWRAFHL